MYVCMYSHTHTVYLHKDSNCLWSGSHKQADPEECQVALTLSWCKPAATVSTCSWLAASTTSQETGQLRWALQAAGWCPCQGLQFTPESIDVQRL